MAGFVWLNRYLSEFEKEWQKSPSKDFVAEVTKKQAHFEYTLQTCDATCTSLAPKMIGVLDSTLDTESLLQRIKEDSKNLDLWDQMKIRIFTRVISEVYSLCLFVCYLRVQLSVIAGYIYVNSKENISSFSTSPSNSTLVINPTIQTKYISLVKNFYKDGINEIIEPVQQAVEQAFETLKLEALSSVNLEDLKKLFDLVR